MNLIGFMEDRAEDRNKTHLFSEVSDAKESLQLLKRDDDGCSCHEAEKCGLGEEVDDETQPEEQSKALDFLQNVKPDELSGENQCILHLSIPSIA